MVIEGAVVSTCQQFIGWLGIGVITGMCETWDFFINDLVAQVVPPSIIILALAAFIIINAKLELIKSFATLIKIVVAIGILVVVLIGAGVIAW